MTKLQIVNGTYRTEIYCKDNTRHEVITIRTPLIIQARLQDYPTVATYEIRITNSHTQNTCALEYTDFDDFQHDVVELINLIQVQQQPKRTPMGEE